MNYTTAFSKIKDKLLECSFSPNGEEYAIQITLSNKDCGGILYIQCKGNELLCEPYDYKDNDAAISLTLNDLIKLIEKNLMLEEGLKKGKVIIEGNKSVVETLLSSLSPVQAAKEAPVAQTPAKRTCKRTCKKSSKTEETKTPAKSPAKKSKK